MFAVKDLSEVGLQHRKEQRCCIKCWLAVSAAANIKSYCCLQHLCEMMAVMPLVYVHLAVGIRPCTLHSSGIAVSALFSHLPVLYPCTDHPSLVLIVLCVAVPVPPLCGG
jgi:hypothetical protein